METPMNANKALWEKGDFTKIAAAMREGGETLVKSLVLKPGMKVLDLGCGDGTTAIPAARTGADVLGVDIAANLVAAGNQRAREANLANCRFQEGDASDLSGIETGKFDQVITVFGAMFAPRPHDVAKEMVRVTKSGGRIDMGNWIPGDPTLIAQVLRISSAYTPPPPEGFVSPMRWGVEADVIDRFGQAGVAPSAIKFANETYVFRFDGAPVQFVDAFRLYYGPIMNAFDAAEKSGRQSELRSELDELFTAKNTSGDPNRTIIPATYLRVTVARP
jgi:ubiquinone/menaquinone biosynthesis C-methylase UbiE